MKVAFYLSEVSMEKYIYADNAATTQLDTFAFEAMKPFLLDNYANASQSYSFARPAKKALKEARSVIANCINAEPDEIYFTSGGTESNNWAIKGTTYDKKNSAKIITSNIEHHAVLNTVNSMANNGFKVVALKANSNGIISSSELKCKIDSQTALVSIMSLNNEIGSIQPIKELCKIAKQYGAIFHTDAVQMVGHHDIDVKELGVDMLSASAHKFNGPKGVGFLYIKHGTNIGSYADGGSQEKSLRAGTENVAGIVGMATALKNNCLNLRENLKKTFELNKAFREGCNKLKVEHMIHGSGNNSSSIISISFKGLTGETILHRLDLKGIYVSTGSACNSAELKISHVLRALNVPEEYAKGTIRISLSHNNTIDEIQRILQALSEILQCN